MASKQVNVDWDFNSVNKCTNLAAPLANGHAMRYNEFGSANYNQMTSSGAPQFANISLGGTGTTTAHIYTQGNQLTGTQQYAFLTQTTANENCTTSFYGQCTQVRTKATSFTLPLGCGVKCLDGSKGAGSTVTVQCGVDVDPLTIGGTSNFGIRLQVASSATGGYNVYAVGTAPNHMTGELRLGTTTSGGGNAILTLADAKDVVVGTTTGTKIATSTSQKLGFWNTTPIVQPTTSVTGSTFTANSGTAVNDASTFGGYTIKQVVAALRNVGLLA